ncbi:uncharacterized protein LOC109727283 [Ananas comosus]|uniref:Uncharacterized protein LOC109727283 n=1 Tax=Ananas comosus TaxID=4615 RepID=A0A6P5GYK7_ANACO|nr:uncharacterized protein LOC109727283 [Ananas comosus]
MATSSTSLLPLLRPYLRCLSATPSTTPPLRRRREALRLLLVSLPAPFLLAGAPTPASALDVPLFGFRKKLERIEGEAEAAVREGERAVEEGIAAAEKGIVAAEKGIVEAEERIVVAEQGIQVAGDLVQAGAVAAAEAVGVLVGLSVVNGILGPEAQEP